MFNKTTRGFRDERKILPKKTGSSSVSNYQMQLVIFTVTAFCFIFWIFMFFAAYGRGGGEVKFESHVKVRGERAL
jgi:hypothetical protein